MVQVTNPFIDTVNPYSSGFFRNPHNAIACFNWGDIVRINATALFGQTITPPSYTTTLRTPNQRFVFTLVTPPYTEQQVSNFIANSPELKLSLSTTNVPTVTFNKFPAGAVEFINKNPTAVKIGLFFHRPTGHANYDYLGE